MLKRSLLLLAVGLFSSHAFAQASAQDTPAAPAASSVGYVNCPTGQSNVFLYQSLTTMQVLATPKCDDQVEVLARVDTLGGYLQVRTANGKEGFVPKDMITAVAPAGAKPSIAIAEPPKPIAGGEGSPLAGPLSQGPSNYGYDIPRAEIFGGYSFLSADWEGFSPRSGLHGWTGSAAINIFPWLGVEGSASGNYQKNCVGATGLNCTILTVLGGPRITVRPKTSISAFGHGLVGIGSLTTSLAGSSLTWRDLAWSFGGGADYAVNNRLSIRMGQVDFLRTQFLQSLGGTWQNDIRISGGVVFRIGKVVSE